MPDWKAIEADFLATGAPYSELAKKWRVPLSTVKKRAMRGEWGKKHYRCVVMAEEEMEPPAEMEPLKMEPVEPLEPLTAVPETVTPGEDAIQRRVERLRRMLQTTDEMMDRVINALEHLKPGDTYSLLTLVKALKELREMQGLNRTALDVEEQRARIAKLKKEASMDERTDNGVTIRFIDTGEAEL